MKVKITHVAVYAVDIEKTREYFEKYFGGTSNSIYKNSKGFSSYFITFDNNVRLEVMGHVYLNKHTIKDMQNGYSHIAFSVGDKETVINLTNQIINDGYELYSPPRLTGDGYFESCVADPDGNRVEITE